MVRSMCIVTTINRTLVVSVEFLSPSSGTKRVYGAPGIIICVELLRGGESGGGGVSTSVDTHAGQPGQTETCQNS